MKRRQATKRTPLPHKSRPKRAWDTTSVYLHRFAKEVCLLACFLSCLPVCLLARLYSCLGCYEKILAGEESLDEGALGMGVVSLAAFCSRESWLRQRMQHKSSESGSCSVGHSTHRGRLQRAHVDCPTPRSAHASQDLASQDTHLCSKHLHSGSSQ